MRLSKTIGLTFLTVIFSMGLSTLALSVDREVYDKQTRCADRQDHQG
jgi:hypothetical protein